MTVDLQLFEECAKQLISPSVAAWRLTISRSRVLQLCDEGKLPSARTPLGRLIPAEAVEELRRRRGSA